MKKVNLYRKYRFHNVVKPSKGENKRLSYQYEKVIKKLKYYFNIYLKKVKFKTVNKMTQNKKVIGKFQFKK
jgi:uncharacterized protein YktA (UPF0223 family)